MTAGPRFAGRFLGSIALGAMAFTVYGSLVPFDFHTRDADDALGAFKWAMTHRWWFESRSDAIANVMLGMPLGFGLLGFLRSDRTGAAGDAVAGLAVLPVSLGLAAAVEFAQLYVPERTTSGSDVLCQGVGAILGMAVWIVCGRWLIAQAEAIWSGADASGRLLIGYLLLLAFVQLLPMDLSASPRDLYRKLRDDVVYVPFSEVNSANAWDRAARLLQVFGLFLPVGLLGARSASKGLFIALVLAVCTEGLQLIVQSRVPSATDALVGGCGVFAGWRLAKLKLPGAALYTVWLSALLAISWQPFAEGPTPAFDWMPGLPLERGHPLFTLEEMITKVVLFALGGALAKSLPRAALGGAIVAGLCEWGQTVFAGHTPSITDVILGGTGAAIGCMIQRCVET